MVFSPEDRNALWGEKRIAEKEEMRKIPSFCDSFSVDQKSFLMPRYIKKMQCAFIGFLSIHI